MNVIRKDLDQNNVTLTIQVEKTDYEEKVEKSLRDYKKKVNMPGFRPGMVPLNLLRKKVGKAVLAEEIQNIASDSLINYIKENNLNILGEPLPNETEMKEIDFDSQEVFEFVFDLGLAPDFDIELTKDDLVDFYKIEVNDEMIDNQVKSYRSNFGHYDEEDEVQEKDMLKGDLLEMKDGKVHEDGRKVEDTAFTADLIVDDEQKSLFLGAKNGDKIVFNPKKAFDDETELGYVLKISKDEANEFESDFQMEIKSITRFHEAEVDQELFDKIFGEGVVTSEEEFRNKILENIQVNLVEDSNYKFLLDVRKHVIEKLNDLKFPDEFLKRWLKETNNDMTDEKMETEYPKMIEELKWQLAKDKIAEKESIKVESNDVNEYAQKVARAQFAQYGMVGLSDDIVANYANELMKSEENVRNYVNRAVEEKVMDVIKNKITLENKTISMDDFDQLLKEDTNA